MKKRESYQRGRVDKRSRKKGTVYTLLYWVRDSSARSGWKLKRETLPNCKSDRVANRELAERIYAVNQDSKTPPKPQVSKAESDPTAPGLTFKSFVEGSLWVAYLDKQQAKKSTRYSYDSMLRRHLFPKFGDLPLTEITSVGLTSFFDSFDRDTKPKYLINIFGLLANIFDVALAHKLIGASPLNRKLHRSKNHRKEKPQLSAEILRGIVAAAPVEHKALFAVAISTGVRMGELIGLRWTDVDFDNHTLSVTGSVWRGERFTPKTDASVRTLGLPPGLTQIRAFRRSMTEFIRPGDFVFARPDGRPYDPDHLRRQVLYPILRSMGIEPSDRAYGFHAFRHSAGSVLYKATRDPKLVQGQLGHSNIQTTLDIYTHLDAEQAEAGTAILVREILGDSCYPLVTQASQSIN